MTHGSSQSTVYESSLIPVGQITGDCDWLVMTRNVGAPTLQPLVGNFTVAGEKYWLAGATCHVPDLHATFTVAPLPTKSTSFPLTPLIMAICEVAMVPMELADVMIMGAALLALNNSGGPLRTVLHRASRP